MIRVLIREAAAKRGIKNAYQFGKDVGFSNRVATRVWNSDQLPKLKTLDRICNAWGCKLSTLVLHEPETNEHTSGPTRKKRIGKKAKAGKSGQQRSR